MLAIHFHGTYSVSPFSVSSRIAAFLLVNTICICITMHFQTLYKSLIDKATNDDSSIIPDMLYTPTPARRIKSGNSYHVPNSDNVLSP